MWKRRAKRTATGLVAILLILATIGTLLWRDRPSLDSTGWASPPLPAENSASVTATWLGVTTLLFDDGETQILIDGFFSRPTLLDSVLRRPVVNDAATINYALHEFDIRRLAAIIPVHSHFDHAMDAGAIARRTSALVLGSESTANIARGAGVPDDQIIVATGGQQFEFGDFRVRLLRSAHAPIGWGGSAPLPGTIDEPVNMPQPIDAFQVGTSYSIVIEHAQGTTLVQGSAGYIEGALETVAADVVMLSVGALTTLDADYAERYWQETVTSTGATTVYAIHFDDFTKPFGSIVPAPRFLGNLEKAAQWLDGFRATWDRETRIYLPRFGEPIALYAQPASTT
ncbi:MAG: MBL fold metallo-hydrolase [Gammaproteobacteria bacterium]|nr:MBL fold metallo-hydrolase [Gammaproteobacteria bacterium]